MKYKDLFRRAVKEAGLEFDEKCMDSADLMVPGVYQEIEDQYAELILPALVEAVKKTYKLPVSEIKKIAKQYNSLN